MCSTGFGMRLSNTTPSTAGFTVIELLVSMAIITIITGIVLFQYSSFNTSSLLTNQAYEIALDIRQAQVFALGERIDGADPRDEWGIRFGVYSGDDQRYVLYRDISNEGDDDNMLDAEEEFVEFVNLDNRFKVQAIKVGDSDTDLLDILFRRPNYDALFYDGGGNLHSGVDEVQIVISPKGEPTSTRTITVTTTGQITVQ